MKISVLSLCIALVFFCSCEFKVGSPTKDNSDLEKQVQLHDQQIQQIAGFINAQVKAAQDAKVQKDGAEKDKK